VNVATFYHNPRKLSDKHHYAPSHIWNCDEMKAQVGRSGGGHKLGKNGSKNVHSIIPSEGEWLSVLCCINVTGSLFQTSIFLKARKCVNFF
jgi:hypothetical protein